MNHQAQINAFTLAAHRLALTRIQDQPALLNEALNVIQRWRQQAGGPSHCDTYWNEWERLLMQGQNAVEQAVCSDTDHAATLRSVSPLGRFIEPAERYQLLRQIRKDADEARRA
jgi:hypothetical protein